MAPAKQTFANDASRARIDVRSGRAGGFDPQQAAGILHVAQPLFMLRSILHVAQHFFIDVEETQHPTQSRHRMIIC